MTTRNGLGDRYDIGTGLVPVDLSHPMNKSEPENLIPMLDTEDA